MKLSHKAYNVRGVNSFDLKDGCMHHYGISIVSYEHFSPDLYCLIDEKLNRVEFQEDNEPDGDVAYVYWHAEHSDPTDIFQAIKNEFPLMSFYWDAPLLSVVDS